MKSLFAKFGLTTQIFVALILAIIVGICMQGCPETADMYIKPWGTIFLNLLKFIVAPLVLLSIVGGILSMEDVSKVGKIGLRAMIYFTLTTVFAVCLGLFVATLIKDYFPTIVIPRTGAGMEVPHLTIMDQIVGFFPVNSIKPFLDMEMMQIIIISVALGMAVVHVGEKGKAMRDFLLSANEVVQKMLGYVMALAPIGIFCMLTPVVATNGPQVLGSYAALMGADYFCFLLHALLVYCTCVYLLARMSPLKFFKGMAPAMLFAYSSDSSVATLPYTMKCAENLGVKKELGSFVLSLGATVNMDGVAIYLGVTSVFIATCCGMDLNAQQYIAIIISSTIASIGTPGIPGGSLALMAMVFASAGIPIEGVAIAAGIDRLVDMARTTMSITGDASCAVILQHMNDVSNEKKKEREFEIE